MTTTERLRLPHFLAALAVLYVAGVALALGGDLATLGGAIANGSELNAPLPIIGTQLLGGYATLRARGALRVAGTVLLIAACTMSLAAAALDGDVGHAGLSGAQVAYQGVI